MDENQGWEASGSEAILCTKAGGKAKQPPLCNLYRAERCRQNRAQDSANNSVD